jgi:hypothetical protein
MVGSGVLMVLMGGLARLDTALVGSAPDALIRMNSMHGAVHALGGLLTIAAGLLLRGRALGVAALGYGALFVFGFVSNLVSPDFFGMMPDAPANAGVHAMHATVALLSLAAGYLALGARTARLATSP